MNHTILMDATYSLVQKVTFSVFFNFDFKNLTFKFSINLTLLGLVQHPLTIRDQCSHDLSPDGLENPVQITHPILS